ncbi:MAG: nucleotide exchange factor GrpE, partial [Patescibacteria group bacterium]
QIKSQLENIFKKYGLAEIKSVGEKFNPEFHEAVEQIESKEESGTIVEEIQKGYLLNNKVLRPSKVKVSK